MGSFRSTLFGLVLVLVWCYAQAHFLNDYYGNEPNSDDHGQSTGSKRTTCECGWTNKGAGRIVGGKVTKVNEYPYMTTIIKMYGSYPFPFCGGTIITRRHVLTAAHCTNDFTPYPTDLHVYVGAHDLRDTTSKNRQMIRIRQIIQHQSYNHATTINDISLLVTETGIQFNKLVGPACLPTGSEKIDGQWIKVAGWGTTSWQGSASDVLKKVNLKAVNFRECSAMYGNTLNENTQFCTYKDGEDSCQGDSGGPLTYLDPETNRYTLVGVVSFGRECASRNPAVNTRVRGFIKWIEDNTAKLGMENCYKRD